VLANSIIKRLDSIDKRTTVLQLQVRHGLDSLPQRLLTEEAKKAISDSIIADVRKDLEKLRNDLQKQIDDLKKGI
jgi:hypothetical protein